MSQYYFKSHTTQELIDWLDTIREKRSAHFRVLDCHGHYSTSSRIAWAKREGRPMNFMFEIDRDAVLAKLFHGGA